MAHDDDVVDSCVCRGFEGMVVGACTRWWTVEWGIGPGHVFVVDIAGRMFMFRREGMGAEVLGPDVLSVVSEAKASSSFSPDPQAAQNFIYRDTIVSK